jgi:hypothetical protein
MLIALLFTGSALGAPQPPRPVQFGPNIMLSGASNFEPAIAVNPLDPNNLVAGFFDSRSNCHSVFTTDGGQTWTAGGAPPQPNGGKICGDVSLAADLLGNFYYGYVNFQGNLEVAKSADGGQTFPTSSIAAVFLDKPYIAVDARPGSPFRGYLYAGYLDFSTGGISVVTSRDEGATWSAPVAIRVGLFTVDGALPVVAPDGTVYVFYFAARTDVFGDMSIMFSKSTDGGGSWSLPAAVASGLPGLGYFHLKNADRNFGTAAGAGIVATSFPTAAIAPDGTIFVAWDDFPQGSCTIIAGNGTDPCTNADVRLSVSRNGGRTWTDPVKVTDETGSSDQFMPWMTLHPDGLLSVVWLDRRLDPDNVNFDAFYTNTYDGVRFLPNVRVSSATSPVGTRTFIGDYNGIAATANGVFPVWDDVRTGKNAIFTATGALGP